MITTSPSVTTNTTSSTGFILFFILYTLSNWFHYVFFFSDTDPLLITSLSEMTPTIFNSISGELHTIIELWILNNFHFRNDNNNSISNHFLNRFYLIFLYYILCQIDFIMCFFSDTDPLLIVWIAGVMFLAITTCIVLFIIALHWRIRRRKRRLEMIQEVLALLYHILFEYSSLYYTEYWQWHSFWNGSQNMAVKHGVNVNWRLGNACFSSMNKLLMISLHNHLL